MLADISNPSKFDRGVGFCDQRSREPASAKILNSTATFPSPRPRRFRGIRPVTDLFAVLPSVVFHGNPDPLPAISGCQTDFSESEEGCIEVNQSLFSLSQILTATTNRALLMETRFPLFPPLDGQPDRVFAPSGVADNTISILNSNIMVALDDVATIRVSGPDAETFLQGQISNDVRKLAGDRVLLAAYNSPKGRVLAVLFLSRGNSPPEILLEMHHAIADGILKRLGAFVLRARVLLEPSDLRVIGLSGPDAAAIAQKIGLHTPRAVDGVMWTNGVQVISRRGENPRFSIRAATARVAGLWNELVPHVTVAGSGAWHLLDLLAGLPIIYPSTQDHFIPQMINLDLLGGISFDKGCYTGQEIVARLHYLGNVKRRMFLIDAKADPSAILPGAPITDGEGEETIGEVVDVAPSGAHQCVLSAVVKLSHAGSERLRLRTNGVHLSRTTPFAPGLP